MRISTTASSRNKKKNIRGQDGRAIFVIEVHTPAVDNRRRNEDRKLSVSVQDVFSFVLTLSARTVVFCSVLPI